MKMTKVELVEAMKDFPDDMEVKVWLTFDDFFDSGAIVNIKNVFQENRRIYIEPDSD